MTLAIVALPGERDRDATKAPCGAGELCNNRTKRPVVCRARFSSCCRYGAAGEQKHLPDWNTTPRQQHRAQQQGSTQYEVDRVVVRKEAVMRNLNYELKQLCRRNRDGSFATQRDRERVLDLVASQLHDMGYRHMAAQASSPSTSSAWSSDGRRKAWPLAPSRTGWPSCDGGRRRSASRTSIARDNDHYGIGHRQYVTNVSKARR